MTISSSLNAGVMGLSANASRLGSISDNIANSATYGYKRVETDFHSMVISGSGGAYAAGGVRTTSQRLIDENGPLISTNNSTDLAVSGRGMMPVTKEAEVRAGVESPSMLLATTGSFRPDAQGYLRSEAGLVLMGWPADDAGNIPNYPRDTADGLEPIRVDSNQLIGQPTTEMKMSLNLPATSTEAGALGNDEMLTIEYFDNLGKSSSVDVTFTPTVPAVGASNTWTMTVTDEASAGATIGEYTLTFNDSRAAGGTLATVTPITGGPYDPVTGQVAVAVAGGPLSIDIGLLNSNNGLSQLSDTFVPGEVSKNGSEVGNMTDVEVDSNGFVNALFDNGATRTLYQIPLVDVPNPNGLLSLASQTYQTTSESGTFFLWDASKGPTGEIAGFSREESATDVAGELTDLIQTQRAYSSNAKVIQTVDEMLQETTNIKR